MALLAFKLNRPLLLLAVLGFILYYAVAAANFNGEMENTEIGRKPAVTQEAAKTAALAWLKENAPDYVPGNTSVLFQTDKKISAYIAKNDWSKEYADKFGSQYPLDFWQVQVADGRDKHPYTFRVDLQKPVVTAWSQTGIEKGRADTAAFQAAERAVVQAGYKLDDFTYSKDAVDDLGRYVFTSKSLKMGEAPLTLSVPVNGNEAVGLLPRFKVPESFSSWIDSQDRGAVRMSSLALLFSAVFAISAIVYTIRYRKQISFSRGVLFTLVTLAVSIFSTLNTLPILAAQKGADPNDGIYSTVYLVLMIGYNVFSAVSLYFSLLSGNEIWRRKGRRLWPRFRDADFGRHVYDSMGRGYLLCIFIIGVQQALLFFAMRAFDSFAISDPTQSEYNMLWPWLLPSLAWMAGISEEATYRLLGGGLFKKLLRFDFLAILIPGIAWALGHTGYAFYPNYTRLFEVTLLALIFGYMMLRYGLYTAIFAHVTMDSLLMSLSFMVGKNSGTYNMLAVFYILLPAIVATVIYLFHRLLRGNPGPTSPVPPRY